VQEGLGRGQLVDAPEAVVLGPGEGLVEVGADDALGLRAGEDVARAALADEQLLARHLVAGILLDLATAEREQRRRAGGAAKRLGGPPPGLG